MQEIRGIRGLLSTDDFLLEGRGQRPFYPEGPGASKQSSVFLRKPRTWPLLQGVNRPLMETRKPLPQVTARKTAPASETLQEGRCAESLTRHRWAMQTHQHRAWFRQLGAKAESAVNS